VDNWEDIGLWSNGLSVSDLRGGKEGEVEGREAERPFISFALTRNYAATKAPALISHRLLTIPMAFPVWNSSSLAEDA
jgi:hypothetical protein